MPNGRKDVSRFAIPTLSLDCADSLSADVSTNDASDAGLVCDTMPSAKDGHGRVARDESLGPVASPPWSPGVATVGCTISGSNDEAMDESPTPLRRSSTRIRKPTSRSLYHTDTDQEGEASQKEAPRSSVPATAVRRRRPLVECFPVDATDPVAKRMMEDNAKVQQETRPASPLPLSQKHLTTTSNTVSDITKGKEREQSPVSTVVDDAALEFLEEQGGPPLPIPRVTQPVEETFSKRCRNPARADDDKHTRGGPKRTRLLDALYPRRESSNSTSYVLGFTKAKEIKGSVANSESARSVFAPPSQGSVAGPPPRSEPFVENEAVVVPSSSGSLQAAVSDGRDVLPSAVKSIIKPRLQNRSTRAFYAKFARQDWVSTLIPTQLQPYATTVASDGSTIEAVTASYGKVMTGLDALERTMLLRCLSFTQYRYFINPCRVSPSAVRCGSFQDAVVMRGGSAGGQNAMLVLPGVVVGSFLEEGNGMEGHWSKKLWLQLLSQEFELACAWMGTVANDSIIIGPINRGSICLQTKKESWVPRIRGNQEAGQGSPERTELLWFGRKSKGNLTASAQTAFLPYATRVPVYDGRPNSSSSNEGFRPTPAGWDVLSSLPLYRKSEIDVGSVVVAGCTLSCWNMSDSDHRTVHFNLMFAIVIGEVELADSDDADDDDSGIETDTSLTA